MTAQRFNILLVEDSPSDARLFEMSLREVAPRVSLYWVATGEEALDALQRTDRFRDIIGIDVVVMDLNLTITDGYSILKKIRGNEKLCAQPVIIMSSSADPDEVRRCYAAGANAYHTKPMSLDTFRELVRCLTRYWLDLTRLPR